MSEQDESEKTEEPTEQRLREARNKGDAPKSQEIASLALLTAGLAILLTMSGPLGSLLSQDLKGYFAHAHHLPTGPAGVVSAVYAALRTTALVVAAPMILLLIVAVVSHGLQSGFIVSAEKMQPKLSKISPIDGAKRLFGLSALANFAKGLAKLLAVGAAGFLAFWPHRHALFAVIGGDANGLLSVALDISVTMLVACLVVVAIIAVADYVGQRMSWMKRQRMSRRDIKDEHKNSEGDPMVKARLRQIRAEKARQRMMGAVPDATVVIANPTHYAVALKYDRDTMDAPVCVAKGVDFLALKIRSVAEEHDVPVIVEPPLARSLYSTVDIDRPIPEQHFVAVAKIIGAILNVAKTKRGRT